MDVQTRQSTPEKQRQMSVSQELRIFPQSLTNFYTIKKKRRVSTGLHFKHLFIPQRDIKRQFFEEYIEEKPKQHIYALIERKIDSRNGKRPINMTRKRRAKTPAQNTKTTFYRFSSSPTSTKIRSRVTPVKIPKKIEGGWGSLGVNSMQAAKTRSGRLFSKNENRDSFRLSSSFGENVFLV